MAGLLLGLAVVGGAFWLRQRQGKIFCPVEGKKCRFEKVKLGQETAYVFQLQPGDQVRAIMDGQLTSGGVTRSERFGQKVCRLLTNQEQNRTLNYCLPLDPEKTSFIKPKNIAKGTVLWQADQKGELVIWGDLEAVWRQ